MERTNTSSIGASITSGVSNASVRIKFGKVWADVKSEQYEVAYSSPKSAKFKDGLSHVGASIRRESSNQIKTERISRRSIPDEKFAKESSPMASHHNTDTQPIGSSDPDNSNLPVVIIHRPPQSNFQVSHWFLPHFYPLECSDPFFSTRSKSARALVPTGPTPINAHTLDQFPSVECVVGSSAGIDHIDLAECHRRGVKVTNAADTFSEDVADYAVGLLIDVLRRVSAADRYVRAGLWPRDGEFPLGSKLGGKRIGIVGLGSIGSMVAKRLEACGCIIAYNSRTKKPNITFPYYSSVQELATNSDALILCCALTNETQKFIDKDVMMAMGKKSVLINVGRGALINEDDLVECLVGGEIAGAGLDVFAHEPHVPKELFGLDNVVLSPHKAVLTPESFDNLRRVIVGNLQAFYANEPLVSEVNFE